MKSKPIRPKLLSSAVVVNPRFVIIYLPIDVIVPDPQAPRLHPRDQVRAIAESMGAFGNNVPLLVDAKDRLVAGHGRLEAAKLLGMTEVPVIRLEHLSEAQAKAFALADNKLSDRSTFDDHLVALRLKELQEMVLDFDIQATGFSVPEIDFRIQSLEPKEASDAADEFKEPDGPSVSRVGDLWKLGPHRLLCGNALDPLAYDMLLETEQAGVMLTDPPYNVPIKGHVTRSKRTQRREFAMGAGEFTQAQFINFLLFMLHEARSRMDPAGVYFMFMDWRHVLETKTAIDRSGCEMLNLCVWSKEQAGLGALYRSAHELVFVFRARGARNRNNVQLGRFGRNRTNVWHYPGMNSFAGRARTKAHEDHPCVKPIALVADAILDVSRPQDIVLDPFTGSGTTILAAERTERRGYGIELDPLYVDLAVTRWEKMTGWSATHACGKTFAEMRAERSSGHVE